MNATQLDQAIYDEWRNMHHNASISRYYPDLQNEYEYDLFMNCLMEDTRFWIEDLESYIYEKYGENLSFYSYGRQGATIAPSEYMGPVGGSSFGPLAGSKLEPYGLDGYNKNRKILAMFQDINKYWRETAKHIPEWWAETKAANEYQDDIDEHEGKTLCMIEVWD